MKNNLKKLRVSKYSSGFTIVELILTVTVLSIGILGVISVINYNVSIASESANKIIAANLAQDGIEMVRHIRDTNWRNGRFETSGGNRWDLDIEGTGNGEYVRFFCVNAEIDNVVATPSGASEESKLLSCGAACQVYAYSSGATKCYGDNYGVSHNGYTGTAASINNSPFYRLIHIEEKDPNWNSVNVTIRWKNRKGQDQYFNIEETLYNWRR